MIADLVLALLQGIVEFLPVSSSAHIAILSALTGANGGTDRSALLHVATAAAVITHYRREFTAAFVALLRFRSDAGGRAFIVAYVAAQVATMGAAAPILLLVALTPLAGVWNSLLFVGAAALVNALVLLTTARDRPDPEPGETMPRPSLHAALLIGLCQGLASVPGLSRSGLTMVAGRRLGMRPADAANFSLLLAPPAILAAATAWLYANREWHGAWFADPSNSVSTIASFALAYAVALVVIPRLVSWVQRGRLWWFAPWSAALAAVAVGAALLD